MSASTWTKEWNNIIRNVLFVDTELKTLMMIPENTTIISFIDKYFIKAGFTNALLSNEDVRIVYGTMSTGSTNVPGITNNELSFDIYVKTEHAHDVGRDRLQLRTELIKDRLICLLNNLSYDYGYHFKVAGEGDMGTRTIGYSRYNVSFSYKKVY